MKSEHRHELQRTEIEKWTEAGAKFFEEYGMKIVIGLVAVVAVVVGVIWYFNSGNKTKEQGSRQLLNATGPKDFLTVADNPDYAKHPFKPAARLKAAEAQLASGISLYFQSTEGGRSDLKKAVENFNQALESDKLPAAERERATYGLAVATEALSGRDTSKAIAAYKKLLSEFPETRYADIAKKRIELLQTDDAKEFYAFFSTHQRKPGDLKKPSDHGVRAAHGGRDVFAEEKPVELPNLPPGLTMDLNDPVKKPKTKEPPKKKDSAQPFPPAPSKDDGKKKGDTKKPAKTDAKTSKSKPPVKTPAKPK